MFVHSVYFWQKEGLSAADVEAFKKGLQSLTTIETVRQAYLGEPADTDRPVIERGYTYGMVLSFDDQAGHDVYQDHETHERFRQQCSPYWSKVLIYDVVTSPH